LVDASKFETLTTCLNSRCFSRRNYNAIDLKWKRLVDVAGIEPATPCMQSRLGKTLNAFAGVAYNESHRNSRFSNVPKLYRFCALIDFAVARSPTALRKLCEEASEFSSVEKQSRHFVERRVLLVHHQQLIRARDYVSLERFAAYTPQARF